MWLNKRKNTRLSVIPTFYRRNNHFLIFPGWCTCSIYSSYVLHYAESPDVSSNKPPCPTRGPWQPFLKWINGTVTDIFFHYWSVVSLSHHGSEGKKSDFFLFFGKISFLRSGSIYQSVFKPLLCNRYLIYFHSSKNTELGKKGSDWHWLYQIWHRPSIKSLSRKRVIKGENNFIDF